MGIGRKIICRVCGDEDVENAKAGMCCYKCYRKLERAAQRNPDARAEWDNEKSTAAFKRSQNKMVKAVYDLRLILEVFKEHGRPTEFLEEDSTVIDTLTDILNPLMDKVKETIPPRTPEGSQE